MMKKRHRYIKKSKIEKIATFFNIFVSFAMILSLPVLGFFLWRLIWQIPTLTKMFQWGMPFWFVPVGLAIASGAILVRFFQELGWLFGGKIWWSSLVGFNRITFNKFLPYKLSDSFQLKFVHKEFNPD
jgi:hypothetical protein